MTPDRDWCGILLAAGKGKRFDALGRRKKLEQILHNGKSVAESSASVLHSILPDTLAVIAPSNDTLAHQLTKSNCAVTVCDQADLGMAHSLIHAIQLRRNAEGWIIALADMPWVQPNTIAKLLFELRQGARIVAPFYDGQRGNPIGFSRHHLNDLLSLEGDKGARDLLLRYPVTEVHVDDIGVLKDVDVMSDLLDS